MRKADKLYAEIDRTGFYRGHAEKDSRSRMNITFRLPSEELEKKFAKESHRGRPRRPQRPPIGRRHARLDLQRLPRGGGRRARRVHEGVRADERLAQVVLLQQVRRLQKSYKGLGPILLLSRGIP